MEVVYLFLPLSLGLAILLLSQGVIQTFSPYLNMETLEGVEQTIPFGPVVSQIAIKQLGTNGGGFFNANSAHPFENPTGITNFLELFTMILIPAASVYAFGIVINVKKHCRLLLWIMFIIWGAGFGLSSYSEHLHDPILDSILYLRERKCVLG